MIFSRFSAILKIMGSRNGAQTPWQQKSCLLCQPLVYQSQSRKPGGEGDLRFHVGTVSITLSMSLSNSASVTSIVEVALTFSFNMLSKKLESIISNPKDREIEEPITMGVTFGMSIGPKFALSQMLKT